MSEKIKGFTVTLEEDFNTDNSEAIMQAIRMIKGVSGVDPISLTGEDHINRIRIKNELRNKFYKFIDIELS